jgi:hypothetical protein
MGRHHSDVIRGILKNSKKRNFQKINLKIEKIFKNLKNFKKVKKLPTPRVFAIPTSIWPGPTQAYADRATQ